MTPADRPLTLWHPPGFDRHWVALVKAPFPGVCMRVTDGDTLDVLIRLPFGSWAYPRIRLANIDCPEVSAGHSPAERALGVKARDFTTFKCLNEQVSVTPHGETTDNRGRFVADVAYRDGAKVVDLATALREAKLTKGDVQ